MQQGSSNSSPLHAAVPGTSKTIEEYDGYHKNDIGCYIGHALKLPPEKKRRNCLQILGFHHQITISILMPAIWTENLTATGQINMLLDWCTQVI